MSTPIRLALSRAVGWLMDRRVPLPLRAPVYRGFAKLTGADASEARLPLSGYPSLGAFFVRTLSEGARTWAADTRLLPSPVDGRVQAFGAVDEGSILQAKGQKYSVRELLAGVGADLDLEGAAAWTLYLSPRDYHRVHCPVDARLREVRWVPGARYSVAPGVLERRARVLATNERVVLLLEGERGPFFVVLVGALNVGRMRVVGAEPYRDGPPPQELRYARGGELGRFEMGSTVVLVWPAGGARFLPGLQNGQAVRLGEPIGEIL